MLIKNQILELKFNVMRNDKKQYFLEKGYIPINKFIQVKAEDLHPGNKYTVQISCDYCEKIFEQEYRKVFKEKKHCCKKCSPIKQKELFLEKHGVENPGQLQSVKDKVRNTNLEKYGVENPGQIPEVKEKVRNTMLEKYGVTNAYQIESVRQTTLENHGVMFPFQSQEIQEKSKQSMLETYGAEYAWQVPVLWDKVKKTMLERYGFEYTSQVPEFKDRAIESMLKTMYKNGTMQTSSQQIHLHNLLGGESNYPVDRCSLDIAFVDEKIDVEYNGGGHYAWPKINGMTDEEHNRKEMNRYSYLKQRGWKLLRIVCKKDKLYDDDKMINLVNECKDYLLNTEHTWIEINIDENKIVSNSYERLIN